MKITAHLAWPTLPRETPCPPRRARALFALAALALQHVLNDFIEGAVANGLYQTRKYMLTLQGVSGGLCRPPFLPLTEERMARARDILGQFKAASGAVNA